MRAGVKERERIVDAGIDVEDKGLGELGHEGILRAAWKPALFLVSGGEHTGGTTIARQTSPAPS